MRGRQRGRGAAARGRHGRPVTDGTAGAGTARRVVYTALVGGYEELLEQPLARSSTVDFVCFTDDDSLRSEDWEVRRVEPALAADRIRSSRTLKIAGHPSLSDYDESLWIDNRVQLLVD